MRAAEGASVMATEASSQTAVRALVRGGAEQSSDVHFDAAACHAAAGRQHAVKYSRQFHRRTLGVSAQRDEKFHSNSSLPFQREREKRLQNSSPVLTIFSR